MDYEHSPYGLKHGIEGFSHQQERLKAHPSTDDQDDIEEQSAEHLVLVPSEKDVVMDDSTAPISSVSTLKSKTMSSLSVYDPTTQRVKRTGGPVVESPNVALPGVQSRDFPMMQIDSTESKVASPTHPATLAVNTVDTDAMDTTSIVVEAPAQPVKLSFQKEARIPIQDRKVSNSPRVEKNKPKQATVVKPISNKAIWELPVGPAPPKNADNDMTPAEYAVWTARNFAESTKGKRLPKIDKVIFFVSGDGSIATQGTKRKMDKIVEWGATLQPKFDPKTATHILVPTTVPSKLITAKELGLKSILDVPSHIPILKWDWFPLHGRINGAVYGPESYDYPAYQETFDNGFVNASIGSIKDDQVENLNDSFDHLSPASAHHAVTASPLDSDDSDSDSGNEETDGDGSKLKGWLCDNKVSSRVGENPNHDVIEKLQQLCSLHEVQPGDDNRWRALGYRKAIDSLTRYPKRITSAVEAKKLPGVGEKTALKIMEIINTGDLQRLKYENSEEVQCIRIFQGIYGVGPTIATHWFSSGCRTLDDIQNRKGGIKLNHAQTIGLKFYDQISIRMPRSEAQRIFDLICPIALRIDPQLDINITGSFRRGQDDCGDIDFLITRDDSDGKTHSGVLSRLLPALHDANILTEDLSVPHDLDALEASYRGLCHLPDDANSIRRRIDILCVPWETKGAALIYYTGDDIFNRSIRLKAKKMGYSLNQRGLYEGRIRDPRNPKKKLNPGTIIASRTEEEIFQKLCVPWQEPHERVRHLD